MPCLSPEILILACSPQEGGNTDAAATVLQRALAESGQIPGQASAQASGQTPGIVYLRDYRILPCNGCNACAAPGNICVLSAADDTQGVLERICAARMLFWLSPIYFYHLPAQAKALIDRAQACWHARQQRVESVLALPPRKAYPLLIAARSAGDNLFKGSLYTLQYCLKAFNFSLGEPLLLTGLDQPGDLAMARHEHADIEQWARNALAEQGL